MLDASRNAWRHICLFALLSCAVLAHGSGCRVAANGQNMQGVRLFQQGQYQSALQQFQKAATNDPTNADAYYNLASTYHRMGVQQNDRNLLAQAEELYERCLRYSGDHADCHRGLTVLLAETNRAELAEKHLRDWAIRSPLVADARIELARFYEELNKANRAEQFLLEAVGINPNSDRAWAALARIREQKGDLAQAMANYQRSLSLNPSQPQVAERLADLGRRATSGLNIVTRGTRTVDTGDNDPLR